MALIKSGKSKGKKCIFYLPYKLNKTVNRARMIRPRKMIEAFIDIGYDVFFIHGYSDERKKLINELKKRINNGERYEFFYTESSTEPTLLTNPNHYPTHPFMDFNFFKYIKMQGIKIGLFYCDAYWMFDKYGENLHQLKKKFAILNYKYDLHKYSQLLDVMYVPNTNLQKYIKNKKLAAIMDELPPGADDIEIGAKSYKERNFKTKPLKVFYVGGLGGYYQIKKLIQAVTEIDNCELTICCRREEFEQEMYGYEGWRKENIHIVHKDSTELEPYYKEADLGSLLFENSPYISLAKPVKSYEYWAHTLPVLSTKGTAIGEIVEQNNLGLNIDYEIDDIKMALNTIIKKSSILDEFRENCSIFKQVNLWKNRAQKVERDLINT